MPLYIVEFGKVQCGEGDYRGVGDVVELEATDKIVTLEHQVMTVDKDHQPVPVHPEQYMRQVKLAPSGTKPHQADVLAAAKKAAEKKAEEMLTAPLQAAAEIAAMAPKAPMPSAKGTDQK